MTGYMKHAKSITSQLKTRFGGNGQFGPNLTQNCDTLYLTICSNIRMFLRHCGIMEQNRYTCFSQSSEKIPFSDKRTIWTQFTPKLLNLISHDLSSIFLKHFLHYGTQYVDKDNIGQFRQKPSFSAIGKFGPKLCNLMSQAIRSYDMPFEKFEMLYYDGDSIFRPK